MGPDMTKFVIHLNRLALILKLNIVYEYSNEEEDERGIPNTSYNEGHEAVIKAWLPDSYAEDSLKGYIDIADRRFKDNKDNNINEVIEEAREFYNRL